MMMMFQLLGRFEEMGFGSFNGISIFLFSASVHRGKVNVNTCWV